MSVRTWQQEAALKSLAGNTLKSSPGIDEVGMATFLTPFNTTNKKIPSFGKRARKSRARRTARRDNKSQMQIGMRVENAMIYGVLFEEMNNSIARTLFGVNDAWGRKGRIENDLVLGMQNGHYWMHLLKNHPDLTQEDAKRLQNYYSAKLFQISRDDEQWGAPRARGQKRKKKHRTKRRVRRRHRKKKKIRKKWTKRRRR